MSFKNIIFITIKLELELLIIIITNIGNIPLLYLKFDS